MLGTGGLLLQSHLLDKNILAKPTPTDLARYIYVSDIM